MDVRKSTPLNLSLYGLVTLGTMVGEVRGIHGLIYICKPLMMVVLSSWFFYNSRRVGDRFTLLIQAGLLFSLIGDVALMLQHRDEFNFLIGLSAFLIAQLCYAMAFLHNIMETGQARGALISAMISVSLIAFGYFFGSRLLPAVDETITIPVTIYVIAITVMGVTASFRLGRTFLRSFLFTMAGAFCFVLSDALLATNRFLDPMDHARWSVIFTYAIAQVLIASGALMHVLDPDEIRRKAALST
ncbi:MAG TPA: lysoplasmalogenase [Flavobacteriales bacterium]|nr:lysoplasmalogenase [Flavobacteriales bacterium]